MKGTLFFGIAVLVIAAGIITSPYWLFREFKRQDHEPLPSWMGEARARKQRLAWIIGVLAAIFGAGMVAKWLVGG